MFYVGIGKAENGLVGQSFSALCASSLEYVSAVSSLHSFSEAMLLFSLTLFGLVSSEHRLHLLMVKIGSVSPFFSLEYAFYTMTRYIITDSFQFVKGF